MEFLDTNKINFNHDIFNVNIGEFGHVKLVDVMPSVLCEKSITNGLLCDQSIVDAARVSYGEGTTKAGTDKFLVKYLLKNKHTSPFEMVEFKFVIKAPLFVARQWMRHRTGCYNEVSARYSIVKDEFWVPEDFRKQDNLNKQGSAEHFENSKLLTHYKEVIKTNYDFYEELLQSGVSRELARTILPVSMMTEFYWKTNLHNLLHFIKLRNDSHAQEEIRTYANIIFNMIKVVCPITCDAHEIYDRFNINLSKLEIECIKNKDFTGETIKSRSEKTDFIKKVDVLF